MLLLDNCKKLSLLKVVSHQQNSPGAHTTRSTYGAMLPKFEWYYKNLGVETKNLKVL